MPTLTAIEVWLVCCIFFIFIALIKYGIVLFMLKKERKLRDKNNGSQKLTDQAWHNQKDSDIFKPTNISDLVDKVDNCCLVILPVLFLIFNTIYWYIYLN